MVDRKAINSTIHIRRQNADPHLTADLDILSHLVRHFYNGCHKCRHKFHRIIIFQKSRLIRNHRIRSRMRFIERILCKIDHLIVDLVCNLLRNTICNAARNALCFISVNKVLALFFHDGGFFLGHRTAPQVASSKRVTRQITYDLHNLLLIYDTAICRLQNRLQLRAVILDRIRVIFTTDILRDKIHRTRTVQGNSRDHILKTLRLQFLHEVFHTRTFQLEHTVRTSRSQ